MTSGVAPVKEKTDRVVGISDLIISADPAEVLITYALGSCLGIAIHDPVAGVGGMLHVMLPESAIDAAKAAANPYMFVDTGVPQLFKQAYAAGAQKARLRVVVAGGAAVMTGGQDSFQIGKRNIQALRKLLWKNGVFVQAQDVGGAQRSRTMSLAIATGEVNLRVNGERFTL